MMRRRFNPPALGSIKAADLQRSGGSSRSFGSIGSGAAHSLACGDKTNPSPANYIEALRNLDGEIQTEANFRKLVDFCAELPAPVLELYMNPYRELSQFGNAMLDRDTPLNIGDDSKNLYCMLKKISEGATVDTVKAGFFDETDIDLDQDELALLRQIAGQKTALRPRRTQAPCMFQRVQFTGWPSRPKATKSPRWAGLGISRISDCRAVMPSVDEVSSSARTVPW